jgi:hypothetical protein
MGRSEMQVAIAMEMMVIPVCTTMEDAARVALTSHCCGGQPLATAAKRGFEVEQCEVSTV